MHINTTIIHHLWFIKHTNKYQYTYKFSKYNLIYAEPIGNPQDGLYKDKLHMYTVHYRKKAGDGAV